MYDFMKKYYIFLVDIRENEYFCAMKVGITICICGTAEKILNGRRYTMQRGTLHIISPLVLAWNSVSRRIMPLCRSWIRQTN